MKPQQSKAGGDLDARSKNAASSGPVEEPPGVPGFSTWRGVYLFVFVTFVVIVAALAIFSRVYA